MSRISHLQCLPFVPPNRHPLYPLLAVLFRQCEAGTVRPCSPPALDLFNEELRVFIDRTTTSLVTSQSQQRSQSPHPSPSAFPLTHHHPTSSSEVVDESKDRNEESNGDVPLNVFMADPELNELVRGFRLATESRIRLISYLIQKNVTLFPPPFL